MAKVISLKESGGASAPETLWQTMVSGGGAEVLALVAAALVGLFLVYRLIAALFTRPAEQDLIDELQRAEAIEQRRRR